MQPDIPVNPFVAKLLGQKACLRLCRTDLYHPNDPWGLEGPFLVVGGWEPLGPISRRSGVAASLALGELPRFPFGHPASA